MEFLHVSDRRHEEIPHLRSPMYYSLYTFSSMYPDINKAVARDILNTGFKRGIARNRGHFTSVINCQRHLFFKMADKNNRSQGKRFPYDILNNLSSLDLFYEV